MTGIATSAEGGLSDQTAPSPPAAAESASGLQDTEPVWTVELTDEEREHAAEVIEKELLEPVEAASIQAGTQEFFNAAEVVEGALPSRARAALAALRRGTVPVVLLRGLPFDEDPGPTPTELGASAETVRRGNAVTTSRVTGRIATTFLGNDGGISGLPAWRLDCNSGSSSNHRSSSSG